MKRLIAGIVSVTIFLVSIIAATARGDTIYVTNYNTGTIGEYDTTTGAVVNASLVSGLNGPAAIAVCGSNLFVTNAGSGTIGEYDATTGAVVNASLVSGLSYPGGIAVTQAVPEPSSVALLFSFVAVASLAHAWRRRYPAIQPTSATTVFGKR
jgi:streptogramin lyase